MDASIEHALHEAIRLYRVGKTADAEAACRQILTLQPNYADASHLLGIIAYRTGRLNEATDLVQRAIAIDPERSDFYNNLGNILRTRGKFSQAIESYRMSIQLRPDIAETRNALGLALCDQKVFDQAISSFRQALLLNNKLAHVHNNLAHALRQIGLLDEAEAACRIAIQLAPKSAETYNNLGNILHDKKRLDEALTAFRQALRLSPNLAHIHSNLANSLREMGRIDEAIAAYRQAIGLDPSHALTYNGLGDALYKKGLLSEATAAYRRCVALDPSLYKAANDLGATLIDQGSVDEAIEVYRRILQDRPDLAETHFNLSHALLLKGDFQEGWREYEFRWTIPWFHIRRNLTQPQWTGQDPAGKTIFVYNDGGLGDMLQFVRYVPLMAARGAKVLLECAPEVASLVQRVPGVSAVLRRGDPLPCCDMQVPLQSLPRAFNTTLENIPSQVPYLLASEERTKWWAARFAADRVFKVGLVWASARDYRSCGLSVLTPLKGIPGVSFYALQKGPGAKQPIPAGLRITHLGEELHDFEDTAAVVMNLDLVISIDTSVAHLCGGVGRPIWTLLGYSACFRWLRDRADSPWYPTMRLFRQKQFGDWASAVEEVAEELRNLSHGGCQSAERRQ